MDCLSDEEFFHVLASIDATTLLVVASVSRILYETTCFSEELLWRRLLDHAKHLHQVESETKASLTAMLADGTPFTEPDCGHVLIRAKHECLLRSYMVERMLPSLPDALRCAAEHDHRKYLHTLLGARADPNHSADTGAFGVGFIQVGAYPLHLAAKKNHIAVLDALFAANACLDATDQNGRTGLMIASASGRVAAAEWLLSRGATVDAVSHWGLTALHLAALQPRADIVEVLLQGKASPAIRDNQDQTPLHLVFNSVAHRTENRQETSCDPGAGDGDEYLYECNSSEGYKACDEQHDILVKQTAISLLLHGVLANALDHRGRTAADILESKCRSDLYNWILEHRAPPTQVALLDDPTQNILSTRSAFGLLSAILPNCFQGCFH